MLQAVSLFLSPLVLLLIAAPAAAPQTKPPPPAAGPAAKKLEEGLSLQKRGKYDQAIRVLKQASGLDASAPLQAEIQVELAETYFRKGKAASEGKLVGVEPEPSLYKAAEIFTGVVKRYPKVVDQASLAAYMTGSTHLLLGDVKEALRHYELAYNEFPASKHRAKALVRIGVCHAGLGNSQKATAIYRRFIAAYPQDKNVPKVRQYIYQTGIVGKTAPAIRASEWLQGVVTNGLSDLRGEVVVVVFFASWCKNCEGELPHLKREMARWNRQGILFIGVANPEDPKSEQPIDFYVQKNQVEFFDVALDRGGRSWTPYRVTGLPAAAVIDRNGVVRWRGHFAFFSHTLMEKLLQE